MQRVYVVMLDPPVSLAVGAYLAFFAVQWKIFDFYRQRFRYYTRMYLCSFVVVGIAKFLWTGWRGWETLGSWDLPFVLVEAQFLSLVVQTVWVAVLKWRTRTKTRSGDEEKLEAGQELDQTGGEKLV
jgi:hypothetical protein